jgi:hypothetical protein
MPIVDGCGDLLELDVRFLNVKMPLLLRLSAGDEIFSMSK